MKGRLQAFGIAASVVSLAAEVMLLFGHEHSEPARDLSLIRIGVSAGAALAFAIGWPAGGALAALILFSRTGFYFLGGENVLVLLGVNHLLMFTIGVWSAIALIGEGRAPRRSKAASKRR